MKGPIGIRSSLRAGRTGRIASYRTGGGRPGDDVVGWSKIVFMTAAFGPATVRVDEE
jgi:hypothetical protein